MFKITLSLLFSHSAPAGVQEYTKRSTLKESAALSHYSLYSLSSMLNDVFVISRSLKSRPVGSWARLFDGPTTNKELKLCLVCVNILLLNQVLFTQTSKNQSMLYLRNYEALTILYSTSFYIFSLGLEHTRIQLEHLEYNTIQ